MAIKNIAITEEAYRRLASFKHENESFSLAITRLTAKRSLGELFGVLSSKDGSRFIKNRKRLLEARRKAESTRRQKMKEAFA